jgi:hypothetical protein
VRPTDIIELETDLFLVKFRAVTRGEWPESRPRTLVSMLEVFSVNYLLPLALELWNDNLDQHANLPTFLKAQLPSTLNYRELDAA